MRASLSSGCSTDSPASALNVRFFALSDAAARAAYLDLLEISPQRSVFAHPDYIQAVGETFSYSVHLAAVEEGGEWKAAAPVFEKRRWPFKASALPPLTPVVTPLLRRRIPETEINQRRSELDTLLQGFASSYDQITFQLHPSLTDTRPFAWAGWKITPRYTLTANLKSDDPVANWSKSVRYTIRTEAKRFGIEEDPRHAGAAFTMIEASYTRQDALMGLDGSRLAALVSRLAEGEHVRVFSAIPKTGTSPEAVAIIAQDRETAHYWLAGSKPGPAMAILLSDVVPRLKAAGITSLDFTGANVPSIAEFKRKYGTSLQTYFLVRLASHPVLRVLDRLRPAR